MVNELEVLGQLTPLGAAGLVAWMWLVERRAAAERERQLTAAHARIVEDRVRLDAVLEVVRENTRVLASLEATQRTMAALVCGSRGGGAAGRAEGLRSWGEGGGGEDGRHEGA
jgi:hypothetical protein